MTFRVIVQSRAKRDLRAHYDWIAERSSTGALRWTEQWEACLQSLAKDPHLYGMAPEAELVPREIRHLFFRTRRGHPYRILFAIEGSVVRVLHVRGPGQPLVPPSELE